jgi:DNA-directed RNA polymerase subunit L
MQFENYDSKKPIVATFTLTNCHVAYANTLRRLIMTGVETAAFRADIKDGTTSDVTIEENDTPMTNEMLAHRIGLLPIFIEKPRDADLESLTFTIDVKAHKDRFRDVTCADFVITKAREEGREPVVFRYDQFFPENPITRDTCLIATLPPGEGRIKLKAKASIGTGRENARFQPTSQCSYVYTRDDDPDKIETHFRDWLRRVKNRSFAFEEKHTKGGADPKLPGAKYVSPALSAASGTRVKPTNSLEGVSPGANNAPPGLEGSVGEFSEDEKVKLAEFRREYETMEIAKVYLKDDKGEPFSYDFTIESVGPIPIPSMVRRACDVGEAMMGKYTTVEAALPTDNKLHVIPSQSRVIGFDFVMKEQDHTFGNMVQTYLEQNHIYEGEEKADGPAKISYAGYEVPHPLRDELVIRIGCTSKQIALKAFAQACKGCVRIFTQMREAWGRAVPEAGRELAEEVLAQGVKNAEAMQGARAALQSAVAASAPAAAVVAATAATKPKKGLRLKTEKA